MATGCQPGSIQIMRYAHLAGLSPSQVLHCQLGAAGTWNIVRLHTLVDIGECTFTNLFLLLP
jgi:hypothetical protein